MDKVTKLTQKDLFGVLRGYAENAGDEVAVAFCDKKIEALSKKRENKGLTAKQKANLELVEVLAAELATTEGAVTIKDIIATSETFAEASVQKVSALLKKLVDAGRVVKTTEKGKTYFSVID